MPELEVVFYEQADGTIPAQDFLLSLNKKMRTKLARTISLLERNGYELREPYSKPLGDGIFELRAQVATNISRVLYFFVVNGKAVLTHGFVKKTEKTPKAEIKRAQIYREDYLRRHDIYDNKVQRLAE